VSPFRDGQQRRAPHRRFGVVGQLQQALPGRRALEPGQRGRRGRPAEAVVLPRDALDRLLGGRAPVGAEHAGQAGPGPWARRFLAAWSNVALRLGRGAGAELGQQLQPVVLSGGGVRCELPGELAQPRARASGSFQLISMSSVAARSRTSASSPPAAAASSAARAFSPSSRSRRMAASRSAYSSAPSWRTSRRASSSPSGAAAQQ